MAELRRAIVRCGGLPIAISGTGEMQWVAGVAVELLWRWRSGEGELSPMMAMAEALVMRLLWRVKKETEARQLESVAECGR